jgi:hypothetical protein
MESTDTESVLCAISGCPIDMRQRRQAKENAL